MPRGKLAAISTAGVLGAASLGVGIDYAVSSGTAPTPPGAA